VVTFDHSEPLEARKKALKIYMSVDNLLISDDTHPVVLYDPSLDELVKIVRGTQQLTGGSKTMRSEAQVSKYRSSEDH
jgi:hypothetical protein